MAIKVIKKYSTVNLTNDHVISTDTIIAPRTLAMRGIVPLDQDIFELTESIKPAINIKLDAYGKPNVSRISLGTQYEHYSTWIHFDLSELLWQIQTHSYNPADDRGYEEEYYYSLYDFRLFFKNEETNEITSWEFDGIDFQIPKEITQYVGNYEIALAILERRDDEDEGNLPDNYSPFDEDPESLLHSKETFITYSWVGTVEETFFNPEIFDGIEGVQVTDTSQLKALVKPPIDCSLADDGFFSIQNIDNSLGVYNDNFIRYLRFNPGKITAHLAEFYIFALFKQNDQLIPAAFEQTTGAFDDISQPLIAWIPAEVYNSAGQWRIMIVAFSKNYHTENKEDERYTDLFYRFLSGKVTMKVEPGFIEDLKLMTDADEQYYISDFVTADEEVIIGSDNAILRGEK